MKKFNIISLLLVFIMLFSTGCRSEANSGSNTSSGSQNEMEQLDYFIYNNSSDYKIVIPENYAEDELLGAHEINTFLLKSCGVVLEIKYDNEINYSASSKIISIGNTRFLTDVNITPNKVELGDYGFILKTIGSSVFIAGATEVGTGALNGVYEFLNRQIGWKCYNYDEFYYNEFDSVRLVNLDITDKPDIAGYISSSYVNQRKDFMKRLRTNQRVEVLGKSKISPYHNMLVWLPPDKYQANHPKWYADNNLESAIELRQLCLTCRGDAEEYQAMLNEVSNLMYDELMTYDTDIVTWTLMDNYNKCNCTACRDAERQYGAYSGQLVKMCNDLSDILKQRFETEGINKDFSILFFAYYYYTEPPTYGTIECRDNVYPLVAPYLEMDRAVSIYHMKNANTKELIDRWSELCQKMGFWIYSVNFLTYIAPFDPFTCLQENYEYFASKNPFYFYDEGFTSMFQENVPGFTALKEYLSCNLAWDTKADVYALTMDFFNQYFKDASNEMYQYYLQYRMKLQILFEEKEYTHNLNSDVLNTKFFEFGTLLSWKENIDNAYRKIAKYKTSDPELYDKLDKRIRIEGITVNYMLLKLYGSYYTNIEYNRMVDEFYDDCDRVGLLSPRADRPIEHAFN